MIALISGQNRLLPLRREKRAALFAHWPLVSFGCIISKAGGIVNRKILGLPCWFWIALPLPIVLILHSFFLSHPLSPSSPPRANPLFGHGLAPKVAAACPSRGGLKKKTIKLKKRTHPKARAEPHPKKGRKRLLIRGTGLRASGAKRIEQSCPTEARGAAGIWGRVALNPAPMAKKSPQR